MRRRIVVAGLVLCVFRTAAEAQLGPTKPSDLADLTSSLASCTLNIPRNNTQAVDRINRPDGSTAPFVIPPQHVFIVTSVELGGLLVPAGKRFDLVLFRVINGEIGGAIVDTVGTSLGGAVHTHVTIPHGSVVKRGTPLCVVATNLDGGPDNQPVPEFIIHGYFARDR